MGEGPLTGRRAGFCAGYNLPGYLNQWGGWGRGYGFFGRGRGGGWGRGFRWRHMYYATGLPGWQRGGAYLPPPFEAEPTKSDLDILREEAKHLEGALKQIQKRISKLEAEEK